MLWQSSIIGLLLHRRYTTQFLHSWIRTWRLEMISVEPLTPVMWAAPLIWPQMNRLPVTSLIAIAEKGHARVTDAERSTMLCLMLVIATDGRSASSTAT